MFNLGLDKMKYLKEYIEPNTLFFLYNLYKGVYSQNSTCTQIGVCRCNGQYIMSY
jgi:hypothetical protein